MQKVFNAIYDALQKNQKAMLAIVLEASGSTPRGCGAIMAVFEDGKAVGSIGGGSVEHEAYLESLRLLKTNSNLTKEYILSPNEIADLGMICGGRQKVFFQFLDNNHLELIKKIVESFSFDKDYWLVYKIFSDNKLELCLCSKTGIEYGSNFSFEEIKNNIHYGAYLKKENDYSLFFLPTNKAGKVYVFGGGHVSQSLVPVIAKIGFVPVVIEDRQEFAAKELFPLAKETICTSFLDLDNAISINPCDYIIIMTRGHQADFEILKYVLKKECSYVGCIGSRGKIALTQKRLREEGICEQKIQSVHSPIGLSIGAVTPDEIAISVAAELIQHRAKL